MILISCPICGADIIHKSTTPQIVILDKEVEFVCNNCYFQYYYNTDRKCQICNKIVTFPYLILQKNTIKLVGKECEKLEY